ncbi:MAG: UDP-3-O-acyl-N-acetylglucosamine deacetylase [Planctomycetaceae bacterium]|jgi:UDP-3-O-acyl N-acetylglucosamine deacetylase|nr:UDP-3-O-acyl-N-acetylglucosamine deacetylase [Planctomycetaceae bacterium]
METNSISLTIDAVTLFSGSLKEKFRFQNTITQRVIIRGFGFWTGEDVCLDIRPAEPDTGIIFVRSDLAGTPRIPALVEYREEKPRQTSLVNGKARVDMVEHLLAALKALQIDNCEIWTDRPEMPGFDGSSQPFILVLKQAGILTQSTIRKIRIVTRAFHVGNESQRINVMPNRYGLNSYQYTLIPGEGYAIEQQDYQFNLLPQLFCDEIMSCRTFLSKREADYLLEQGLCQRVTPKDVLVLTEYGPLDNTFRFSNECARHKILDMVGDFSLADCDWVGSFESWRGGHSLNAECVKQLLENTILLDESFLSKRKDLTLNRAA